MTTEAPSPAPAPSYDVPTQGVGGARIMAAIIDMVVLFILLVVMAGLFGDLEASGGNYNLSLNGFPAAVYLVLAFAYSIVLEAQSGQTIGKKITGIKVVALDGEMSWGKSAIRNLLRIVDGFPYFIPYLVGFIASSASKRDQRIGDMAAGTIVVRA